MIMVILMIVMDFLSLWQAALPSRISKSGLVQFVAVNIAHMIFPWDVNSRMKKGEGC